MAAQEEQPGPATSSPLIAFPGGQKGARVRGMCVGTDATTYFTLHFPFYAIFKAAPLWPGCSQYSPAVVLAGTHSPLRRGAPVPPEAPQDSTAGCLVRFGDPGALCMHPLQPGMLLVADGSRLRSVCTSTGATNTLQLRDSATSLPFAWHVLACCSSSGGGPHAWLACEPKTAFRRSSLWRADMRDLTVTEVTAAWSGLEPVRCMAAGPQGQIMCVTTGRSEQHLWQASPGDLTPVQTRRSLEGVCGVAVAGDGTVVLADGNTQGYIHTVSPLTGKRAALRSQQPPSPGRPKAPRLRLGVAPEAVAVLPSGHVVAMGVMTGRDQDRDTTAIVAAVVEAARLLPPTQLPPAPSYGGAGLCSSLLDTGLLADTTIRVVAASGSDKRGRDKKRARTDGSSSDSSSQELHNGGKTCDGGGGGGEIATGAVVDIGAHRAILAAASPYFRARFAGPLAAAAAAAATTAISRHEVVTVRDAGVGAVRAALRHMYTGAVGHLGSLPVDGAQDLLHLAQQWGLDALLDACQAHVAQHLLGPGNATEWLVCANLRQYGHIQQAALRAVVQHIEAVRGDAAQVALLESHPSLLLEALGAAAAMMGVAQQQAAAAAAAAAAD